MNKDQLESLQIVRYNLIDYLNLCIDKKEKDFISKQIQGINYVLGGNYDL